MRSDLPCLPLIQERFWNEVKEEKEYAKQKYYPEFELRMFSQTWGSTSLGFGGIGGQAMTMAYTTVIYDVNTGWCGVFFGERLAYKLHNPNQDFWKDVSEERIEKCSRRGKYLRGD